MRRCFAAVLTMLLCLLTACGKQGKDDLQAALDQRAALLAAGGCSFTAEIRADVGERLYEVTLACELDADGGAELTVLAPESIAGVQLRVDGRTGRLGYADVTVDFGSLSGDGLAPAELPTLLLRYWQAGYIDSAGREDGLLHVQYTDDASDGALRVDTWYDEDGLPVQAEIVSDGQVAAVIRLTDVAIHGG